MHVEDIEYEVDGRRMVGHLAYDDGRAARVRRCWCHEGNGLDERVKGVAERLAGLGYGSGCARRFLCEPRLSRPP